jgi:hypothetical protein
VNLANILAKDLSYRSKLGRINRRRYKYRRRNRGGFINIRRKVIGDPAVDNIGGNILIKNGVIGQRYYSKNKRDNEIKELRLTNIN